VESSAEAVAGMAKATGSTRVERNEKRFIVFPKMYQSKVNPR
jgi:uncharacterized membrane protein YvbJ